MLATLLLLVGLAGRSQAQVYYVTNDAQSTTSSTTDAVNRMNYDGSSPTNLINSFTTVAGAHRIRFAE